MCPVLSYAERARPDSRDTPAPFSSDGSAIFADMGALLCYTKKYCDTNERMA